jgi:hypothetical protein
VREAFHKAFQNMDNPATSMMPSIREARSLLTQGWQQGPFRLAASHETGI